MSIAIIGWGWGWGGLGCGGMGAGGGIVRGLIVSEELVSVMVYYGVLFCMSWCSMGSYEGVTSCLVV